MVLSALQSSMNATVFMMEMVYRLFGCDGAIGGEATMPLVAIFFASCLIAYWAAVRILDEPAYRYRRKKNA